MNLVELVSKRKEIIAGMKGTNKKKNTTEQKGLIKSPAYCIAFKQVSSRNRTK